MGESSDVNSPNIPNVGCDAASIDGVNISDKSSIAPPNDAPGATDDVNIPPPLLLLLLLLKSAIDPKIFNELSDTEENPRVLC